MTLTFTDIIPALAFTRTYTHIGGCCPGNLWNLLCRSHSIQHPFAAFWVCFADVWSFAACVCEAFYCFFLCLDSSRGSCPGVVCCPCCPVTSSGGGVRGRLLDQRTQGDDSTTHPWPSAATQPVGKQPPLAWSAVACDQAMASWRRAWASQPTSPPFLTCSLRHTYLTSRWF